MSFLPFILFVVCIFLLTFILFHNKSAKDPERTKARKHTLIVVSGITFIIALLLLIMAFIVMRAANMDTNGEGSGWIGIGFLPIIILFYLDGLILFCSLLGVFVAYLSLRPHKNNVTK